MIGVLLKSSEKHAVEEFFQLFKTPWEFFVPGRGYEVVISDHADAADIDTRLVILLRGGFSDSSSSGTEWKSPQT